MAAITDLRVSRERAIDMLLWGLAVSSGVLTLWLSLGPVPPGTGAFPGADKVLHGTAYLVTTLLLLFAGVWRPGRGPGPLTRFAPALIVVILVSGLLVELLQTILTARRQAEFADWVADAAGVLAAALIHALVRRAVSEPSRLA